MKPHTTGRILIRPACAAIVRIELVLTQREKQKMPFPDVTINRRISGVSVNIEKKVYIYIYIYIYIKGIYIFALQLDESMDIGGVFGLS
jgi:hypothetical protein